MKTIIMFAALTFLSIISLKAQQTQLYDDRPKIAVNGEAVVMVKPDKIVVTAGVTTWDADIILAKEKNNDIIRKAMKVIRELGISESDVQTDQLSIKIVHKNNNPSDEVIGYSVENTIVVMLAEPKKVEELVTKILQAGMNIIRGIEFQTSEFRKYRDQARDLALKAAREKAERMAGVFGQSVGEPIYIGERDASYSRQISLNSVETIQSGSGETPDTIALGKISMRANVSVTFELKK